MFTDANRLRIYIYLCESTKKNLNLEIELSKNVGEIYFYSQLIFFFILQFFLVFVAVSVALSNVMLEIFFDVFSLVVLQPLSLPIVSEDPSQPWNLSAGLASKEPVLKLLSAGYLLQFANAGGEEGRAIRQPIFEVWIIIIMT